MYTLVEVSFEYVYVVVLVYYFIYAVYFFAKLDLVEMLCYPVQSLLATFFVLHVGVCENVRGISSYIQAWCSSFSSLISDLFAQEKSENFLF